EIPLGRPGGALGHPGVLELVEGEIGRSAGYGPIPSASNHTWHLFVVGHVDGVVPGVELVVDLRWHIHSSDLEGRRHVALGGLTRQCLRVDQGVDVTDVGGANDLGGRAPGPFGAMGPEARVRLALQHRGALELIAGEVLRPTLHRFVSGRTGGSTRSAGSASARVRSSTPTAWSSPPASSTATPTWLRTASGRGSAPARRGTARRPS